MADVITELVKDSFNNEGRDITDINIVKFDSGGANYTSTLYNVVVTTADDETHLFAKVASFGESMRENINADWIYYTERFVYTKLAEVYEEIQRRHSIPQQHRYVFPKFYGCNSGKGNETVVTEDLCARGYTTYDRFRPLDWEYAVTAIEALARFHALSFAFEKEQPEEFEKISKEMYSELVSDNKDESVKQFWMQMVETALSVISEEKRDRVRKVVYDEKVMKRSTEPVDKVVLAHGDYRLSNLLFKNENGEMKVVPVDYQLVHSGCAAMDLLYFVSLGSDQQFRAKYFRKLVDYYYKQLALSLERLSVDIVEVYPRETFDRELEKKLPLMALHGVMILPVVTVDADDAPKVTEDVSNFVTKPNEMYKERFEGIIDDLIEWGAI